MFGRKTPLAPEATLMKLQGGQKITEGPDGSVWLKGHDGRAVGFDSVQDALKAARNG